LKSALLKGGGVAWALAAAALLAGCRGTPEHPPRFAVAPPQAAPAAAKPAASFGPVALEDLEGRPASISFPRERPLILTLSDFHGVPAMERWAEALAATMPAGVDIQGVALLAGTTPAMRPLVRGHLKRKFTRAPLLDWGGASTNQLPFTPGVPNLHLLDKKGRVIHTAIGEPGAEAVESLLSAARHIAR